MPPGPPDRWPIFHGYSPSVLPRPADWPDPVRVTGYRWPAGPPAWRPSRTLVDFLDAGPPPVFVGFGSMIPDHERLPDVVATAVARAGVRAAPKRVPLPSSPISRGSAEHERSGDGGFGQARGEGPTVSPMSDAWLSDTRSSYDIDAPGYAEKVRGLLDDKPYLRASLSVFAESVLGAGGGPVLDVGCGPGYVTRHLHDAGVDAFGIDLSPELIAIARRDHPDLRFEVGTMTDLDLEDQSVAGILAFWSVIHVPDRALPGVVEQFRRVLRPGGPLLVGFHVGDGTEHTSEGYTGRRISVDSYRRRPRTMAGWLRDAGFRIEAELVMRPDDDVPGAVVFARAHG